MNYETFVFYGSWRETLEGFREDFGDEYAKEALWNLMTLATAGDVETTKKSIIGFITGAVMPNIDAAKARYAAQVENGKKGGRPTIDLDRDEVMQKKAELRTWKAVAAYYNISEQTLKNKRNEWENPKNPKNLEKEIEKEKEIEDKKENKKEEEGLIRHIDSFSNGMELQAFKEAGGTVIYDEEDE